MIPLYFNGKNSPFFYNFAKLRTRLGIKFNIEMIYLPREMVRSENSTYSISIGSPIAWQTLQDIHGNNMQAKVDEVRRIVYNLKP